MRLLFTFSGCACSCLGLLLLMAAVPAAVAEPAAPYGRYFVRAGASWPAEEAPALAALPEAGGWRADGHSLALVTLPAGSGAPEGPR